MKILIFIVAITLSPSYGFAGWFGPSTYEECVLENIKDVKGERAATLLAQVCRKKFPVKCSEKFPEKISSQVIRPPGPMSDEEFDKFMEERRQRQIEEGKKMAPVNNFV
jgi:hypothetical protein